MTVPPVAAVPLIEALQAIDAQYHFVEGSLVGVAENAPHWEKCPGCIAGRALAAARPVAPEGETT